VEPGLGYSTFDVESKDQLEEILDIKPYSEVYEVDHVVKQVLIIMSRVT